MKAQNSINSNAAQWSEATLGTIGGGHMRLPPQDKPSGWEHDMHWHVFDFSTLSELLRCLDFSVEIMELVEPYHMLLIGQKN